MTTDQSPYVSPSANAHHPSSGVSEMAIAKNWMIFILVATIGGALAGMFAGAIVGFTFGMLGASMQVLPLASGLSGFVAGLPVSYLTYRWRVKRLLHQAFEVPGDMVRVPV